MLISFAECRPDYSPVNSVFFLRFSLLVTGSDSHVARHTSAEAWQSSGQVLPKMAKRTAGKGQILKKNDILELFDFCIRE